MRQGRSDTKIPKKNLVRELKGAYSYLSKSKLIPIDSPTISEDLLRFETRQVITGKSQ